MCQSVFVCVSKCVCVCGADVGYAGDKHVKARQMGVQVNYLGRCEVVIAQYQHKVHASHVNAYCGYRLPFTFCSRHLLHVSLCM